MADELEPVVFAVLAEVQQAIEAVASVATEVADMAASVAESGAQIQASLAEMSAGFEGAAAKAQVSGAEVAASGEKGAAGLKHMAEAIGLFAAFDFLKDSAKDAATAQASMQVLDTSIQNAGQSVQKFTPAIEESMEQMRALGFTNQETTDGIARLTQMTHSAAAGINLEGLAADLARAKHMDFGAAIRTVGLAATGHVAMLNRLGLETKDAAGHTLSAKAAIEAMAKSFGGTAQAYSGTMAGQMAKFHAQLDEEKEKIGNALIPALMQLMPVLLQVAQIIANDIIPALTKAAHLYQQNKAWLDPLIVALGTAYLAFKAAAKITLAYRTVAATMKGVMLLWTAGTEAQTLAQEEQDAALAANPIGAVIAVIMALVAVIVYAWKHFQWFRDVVTGTWNVIVAATGNAVAAVINYYLRPLVGAYMWMAERVVDAVDGAFGWIPGLGNKLDDAKDAVHNFAQATDNELAAWAKSASGWSSNWHSSIKKGTKDTKPPEAPKTKDYGAGLSDASASAAHHAKTQKHHKDRHASALAEQKKRAAEILKAQKAHDAAMLAEAKAAAAAQLAVLKQQLAESQQRLDFARQQMDAANARDVLFVNNQLANVGTSMLNLGYAGVGAGGGGPTVVNVNVAGSVVTQQQLVNAVQTGLLVKQRTNSSLGIQPSSAGGT